MTTTISRFAVLKIQDDDDAKAAQRAANLKNRSEAKSSGKKTTVDKELIEKKAAKKKKNAKDKADLLSLAFGGSKPKKSGASQKIVISSGKVENSVNSADWKKRDKEFIEGTFENELKEALLASKVEFEENQELKDLNTNESENEIPLSKKKTGNKKGTTTMSLDQFNHVSPEPVKKEVKYVKPTLKAEDAHFFDEVNEEADKMIKVEKNLSTMRKKKSAPKPKEAEISEAPRLAQLQEELKESNAEVEKLRLENETLRQDLLNVKTRNKKLCSILVQGEMKEKTEILVEMDKLTKVKDELTIEVNSLAVQLQQERSKVSALTNEAKKTTIGKK